MLNPWATMKYQITSAKNERIKNARKLHRKRYRDEYRQIPIEGVRLIEDALDSFVVPDVVFFTPDLISSNVRASSLLDRLKHRGVETLACTPGALAPLVSTETTQGIVAIVPQPLPRWAAQATLILVLDGVRDPGNAGTLLRSAKAAGVDQVLFGPRTVDPYNNKVLRAAMGAHFRLPIQPCVSWQHVLEACHALLSPDCAIYLASPQGEVTYDLINWRIPSALIVGGEATGAGPEAANSSQRISIPMSDGVESLNAAVAGSIILFEAARQRRGTDTSQ